MTDRERIDDAIRRLGQMIECRRDDVAFFRELLDILLNPPDASPETPRWQPYHRETPPADEAFFWVVPKEPEECYTDTSGKPISVWSPNAKGRLHRGKWGTWSALEKATHWMPLPAPPSEGAASGSPEKQPIATDWIADSAREIDKLTTLRPAGVVAQVEIAAIIEKHLKGQHDA